MNLLKIKIENFRSIASIDFDIKEINGSFTYSLLGINESGKSSILKAISLIDEKDVKYPLDYLDTSKSIEVSLTYALTHEDIENLKHELKEEHFIDDELLKQIIINFVTIQVTFPPTPEPEKIITEVISFENVVIKGYTIAEGKPVKKNKDESNKEDLKLDTLFSTNSELSTHFWSNSHHVTFWRASPEYLILDDIDLDEFSKTPKTVSIPLKNCFALAGIKSSNIPAEIGKLVTAGAIYSLQSRLSANVTQHINTIWPEHPVQIRFQIHDKKISLLVEDNEVQFQPKTTGQRSDGFKQFISFLLTVSAENYSGGLTNTILLIDEPETHLHPPAQLNLLQELVQITSNKKGNILFFATHSNYLIDKNNLDRNYKVSKKKNQKTFVEKIEKKRSTYSEVNYEVFGIETTDYHNELYGYIESENKSLFDNIPKDRKWINAKNRNTYPVSISEYIRHSIHHPENSLNKPFSGKELKDSIKKLRELKNSIMATE